MKYASAVSFPILNGQFASTAKFLSDRLNDGEAAASGKDENMVSAALVILLQRRGDNSAMGVIRIIHKNSTIFLALKSQASELYPFHCSRSNCLLCLTRPNRHLYCMTIII